MADPEVATKAPEIDVVIEDSDEEDEEDALTHTAQGLGEHCITDRPTPSGQGPSGEITQIGGVDAYISKPADYPHSPSKLLLFLTPATGLHSQNNQIQADKFAREGFVVILPDMFANDPLPGSIKYEEEEEPSSLIEKGKLAIAAASKSFLIDMWLARQTPEKVLPIIHKVIDAVKDEYADAVANGGGIYAVGYCFGGRMVLLLAGKKTERRSSLWGQKQTDEESGTSAKGPYIKAGAIAHATLVERGDFEGTEAPLSFICVEDDQLFPNEVRDYGEHYLSEKSVKHEFKTYSGVPHGFAVFGEYEDSKIKTAQGEAFTEMLAWLKSS
ncbi:dienelactone hydrolase family protein-like protein [Xylogone sp. PMI_703]|nr:dienelactone hydrolase family protein-like protein [Xylogone sp. PMI_703]